ncbi:MAG: hypothetical protein MZU79_01365 [Anaerotruncus sp.]|nr:hypothetical protein [Anaerotruncus sp.]
MIERLGSGLGQHKKGRTPTKADFSPRLDRAGRSGASRRFGHENKEQARSACADQLRDARLLSPGRLGEDKPESPASRADKPQTAQRPDNDEVFFMIRPFRARAPSSYFHYNERFSDCQRGPEATPETARLTNPEGRRDSLCTHRQRLRRSSHGEKRHLGTDVPGRRGSPRPSPKSVCLAPRRDERVA